MGSVAHYDGTPLPGSDEVQHLLPTQAVTVTEIRARLQREAAFAGQARVITVRPRQPRPPPR